MYGYIFAYVDKYALIGDGSPKEVSLLGYSHDDGFPTVVSLSVGLGFTYNIFFGSV